MNKRALWIFDKNYLMLTYLSVSSFLDHCDINATLIYCGDKIQDSDKNLFLSISKKVEILHFDADVSHIAPHMQANVLNRFARLHYTRLFEDDILFMVDSDVSFSPSLKQDIKEIDERFQDHSLPKPMLSGVVEFLSAEDAYLYYRKLDKRGYTRKTTEESKISGYESVFGNDWRTLIKGFQFNNGFLIFYKAKALIDQWEEYYLKALGNKEINPLDDQVPLAVAIQKTGCDYWKLTSKWNSLGDLVGSFTVFHAWGGEWKIEIDQVLRNQRSTSDYGEICKRYLSNCPDRWISKFKEDLKSEPYRYRQIQGAFDHGTVFSDLINELIRGHVVEVGTYKGRSACFVAELIKSSNREIIFDTIDHYNRDDNNIDLVLDNLQKAGVDEYVNVVEAYSLNAAESYENNKLDFVILDTDSPREILALELDAWYDKIKEGGYLAGYDHSIHDLVKSGFECATTSFCEKNNLPLKTYEYYFQIQKPIKLNLSISNVGSLEMEN